MNVFGLGVISAAVSVNDSLPTLVRMTSEVCRLGEMNLAWRSPRSAENCNDGALAAADALATTSPAASAAMTANPLMGHSPLPAALASLSTVAAVVQAAPYPSRPEAQK